MKLVEHKAYKGMFYLQWPDGSMSDDFYNKTRARYYQIVMQSRIDSTMPFAGPRKAVGAFK